MSAIILKYTHHLLGAFRLSVYVDHFLISCNKRNMCINLEDIPLSFSRLTDDVVVNCIRRARAARDCRTLCTNDFSVDLCVMGNCPTP